jgi:ribosome-associated protein
MAAHDEPETTGPAPVTGPMELAPGVSVPASVVRFAYSTSRGPGGQNVNKRLTKAELRIAPGAIPLSARARARLEVLAGGRITGEGDLVITADEFRSQRANREACLDRLRELIILAKVVPKPRRPTKPTRGSVQRRLEAKKQRSQTKGQRRIGPDAGDH